eukprot:365083-Chlamydomonas_euryale.AAC.15
MMPNRPRVRGSDEATSLPIALLPPDAAPSLPRYCPESMPRAAPRRNGPWMHEHRSSKPSAVGAAIASARQQGSHALRRGRRHRISTAAGKPRAAHAPPRRPAAQLERTAARPGHAAAVRRHRPSVRRERLSTRRECPSAWWECMVAQQGCAAAPVSANAVVCAPRCWGPGPQGRRRSGSIANMALVATRPVAAQMHCSVCRAHAVSRAEHACWPKRASTAAASSNAPMSESMGCLVAPTAAPLRERACSRNNSAAASAASTGSSSCAPAPPRRPDETSTTSKYTRPGADGTSNSIESSHPSDAASPGVVNTPPAACAAGLAAAAAVTTGRSWQPGGSAADSARRARTGTPAAHGSTAAAGHAASTAGRHGQPCRPALHGCATCSVADSGPDVAPQNSGGSAPHAPRGDNVSANSAAELTLAVAGTHCPHVPCVWWVVGCGKNASGRGGTAPGGGGNALGVAGTRQGGCGNT